MELTDEIFKKARQIAMEYPMPPGPITESDARAMMENASIQLVEKLKKNLRKNKNEKAI